MGDGSTVISYRGTDNFVDVPFFGDNAGGDAWNGWSIGFGSSGSNQAAMAFEFYNAVAQSVDGINYDPKTSNIILVGHSLGGGLAGLVGWIYGKEADMFDNMPFDNATMH